MKSFRRYRPTTNERLVATGCHWIGDIATVNHQEDDHIKYSVHRYAPLAQYQKNTRAPSPPRSQPRKPNIVDLGPGQRALSEVDPTPSIESSSSLSLPPSGSGASGDGIKFVKSSTAPPRLLAVPEKRTVAAAAAAMTVATTTTTVMATTIAPAARGTGEKLGGREAMGVPSSASALDMRSSGGGGDIGNNDRGSIRARSGSVGSRTAVDRTGGASGGRNKNSAVAWVSSGTARAVATGEGVARGGIGMVVAAGAGGTKVMKQLLPSFVTKDPEVICVIWRGNVECFVSRYAPFGTRLNLMSLSYRVHTVLQTR